MSLRMLLLLLVMALINLSSCATEEGDDGEVEADVSAAEVADAGATEDTSPPDDGESGEVEADAAGEDTAPPPELPPLGDPVDLDLTEPLVFEGAGHEYYLMLFSPTGDVDEELEYSLKEDASTGTSPAAPATPSPPSGEAQAPALDDFGARVAQVREAMRAAGMERLRPPLARRADPPQVGDGQVLYVSNGAGQRVEIIAEAVIVSEELVILLDRTNPNPNGELDPADPKFDEIVAGFESLILPRERFYFGQESDVNGDGHVSVLFTPLVPEIGAMAYVSPTDLLEPEDLATMGLKGNHQELIYVTPPNMMHGPMGSSLAALEVLAHEFSHSIYFFRKYVQHGNGMSDSENIYLTEGFAAMAQDLSGYQLGNLIMIAYAFEPRGWSLNDVTMDMYGYIYERDGELRALSALLVRYLLDQAGGDPMGADGTLNEGPGVDWLRSWYDSPESGLDNVIAHAPWEREELWRNFYLTLLLDDRTAVDGDTLLNEEPAYNFLPTMEDPVTGRIRGMSMFITLPMGEMEGPPIADISKARKKLRLGGVEYLRVRVPEGQPRRVFKLESEQIEDLRAVMVRGTEG
jgi:hypothetical protein